MVEYLITHPLAMVGVFVVAIAVPLLYEVMSYLRTRGAEPSAPPREKPVQVPVPVETKPARRKRKY